MIKRFLDKAENVLINVKGEDVVLLSKAEITHFIRKVYNVKFVNRSRAKQLTNLSYLGGVNSSAKIVKGKKLDYNTFILYLQPYKTLFGNTCPKAVTCVDSCLNTSGRVKMDVNEFKILKARYLKTVLFYVNRDLFNGWLFAEIESHSKRLPNFMIRLNGTSDLSPKLFNYDGVNVLDKFQELTFYDYTKVARRIFTNLHTNYHLTFSYDGLNMKESLEVMSMGVNVSIVFKGEMPKTYKGVDVFTMDDTDLRPLDKKSGAWGYLKLKETLNKEYDNRFVVDL